ncbi:MAG: hypothetical protein R6V17_00080 [Halanaerobacter sp.]
MNITNKQWEKYSKGDFTVEEISQITGIEEEKIKEKAEELGLDIRYKDFKKEHEIDKSKYEKPRFRSLNKWNVTNRVLFGVLFVEDIKPSELADMIGVTTRSVERWCFENADPSEKNKEKISAALKAPKEQLFSDWAHDVANPDRLNKNN